MICVQIGRDAMKSKIFLMINLWILVTIIVMGLFHYPIIKQMAFDASSAGTENQSEQMSYELTFEMNSLKLNIEAYALKLSSGGKWLDVTGSFLKSNDSVLEVHLFDKNRQLINEKTKQDTDLRVEKKSLEGMFFYQTMILEQYDREKYLIYYKGSEQYFVFLVDLNHLFGKYMAGGSGMQGVYDQFSTPVAVNGKDLDAQRFLQEAGKSEQLSGYFSNMFYAIKPITFENLNFNVMSVNLDQTYQRTIRLYLVRFIILSLTLLTLGFLVAWRVLKTYRHALLTEQIGNLSEINDIRTTITMAIKHMDGVSKTFDDFNVLKEELEMLYADLIEGVKADANENKDQEHK